MIKLADQRGTPGTSPLPNESTFFLHVHAVFEVNWQNNRLAPPLLPMLPPALEIVDPALDNTLNCHSASHNFDRFAFRVKAKPKGESNHKILLKISFYYILYSKNKAHNGEYSKP